MGRVGAIMMGMKVRPVLARAQEGLCAICGQPVDPHENRSIDHVIPLSAGGANGLGNLVLTHRSCNTAKASNPPCGCELIWLLAVNNRLGVEPMRW